MHIWIKAGVAAVIVLAAIQIVRPNRTNPTIHPAMEISSNSAVPAEVSAILARSCGDCHSHRTVWPWYSAVAPVSWLVAYDVTHGRQRINFSEWAARPADTNGKILAKICTEVTDNEMPGFFYPLMHPAARLSDYDKQAICQWTRSMQQISKAREGHTAP